MFVFLSHLWEHRRSSYIVNRPYKISIGLIAIVLIVFTLGCEKSETMSKINSMQNEIDKTNKTLNIVLNEQDTSRKKILELENNYSSIANKLTDTNRTVKRLDHTSTKRYEETDIIGIWKPKNYDNLPPSTADMRLHFKEGGKLDIVSKAKRLSSGAPRSGGGPLDEMKASSSEDSKTYTFDWKLEVNGSEIVATLSGDSTNIPLKFLVGDKPFILKLLKQEIEFIKDDSEN